MCVSLLLAKYLCYSKIINFDTNASVGVKAVWLDFVGRTFNRAESIPL
jgi:hypothetical protein